MNDVFLAKHIEIMNKTLEKINLNLETLTKGNERIGTQLTLIAHSIEDARGDKARGMGEKQKDHKPNFL